MAAQDTPRGAAGYVEKPIRSEAGALDGFSAVPILLMADDR
jgi:hypothetical protein